MIKQVMSRVLVVGSGITGAVTASILRHEHPKVESITIWDKSHGSGGRMSTSRKPGDDSCTVDLGAQYFTLFPEYKEKRQSLFEELVSEGVFQPFQGVLEGDNSSTDCKHYIAPAGSGSLVKHFLSKSEAHIQYDHQISNVSYDVGKDKVKVTTSTGTSEEFDVLILTMPVPQMLQLQGSIKDRLAHDPEILSSLEKVSYSSRFCLGLFYNPDTNIPYTWDAKYFFDGPCIRFVSIDNRKRGKKDDPPSVLVHTSVPFSLQHLEVNKEEMTPIIMQHLRDILPDLPEPELIKSHKWRYSQVFKNYQGAPGCVILDKKPLVILAGDAFAQKGNFSGAVDSAEATAQAVKKYLGANL